MATLTVEVRCVGFVGRRMRAEYVRHLRTFTHGDPAACAYEAGPRGNTDLDLYRLRGGVEVEGYSDAGDCRRPIMARVSPEVAEQLGLRRRERAAQD